MIRDIEDLEIWQIGKKLVVGIYNLTSSGNFKRDFALIDQIRRSALSIPSNIAEGFGRGGNKEFINFLYIAIGSLYETKSHLLIGEELGYIEETQVQELLDNLEKLKAKTLSMITHMKEFPYKGTKFKKENPEEWRG